MSFVEISNMLHRPLVLLKIEEKKDCLGHELPSTYKKRDEARITAFHWTEGIDKDPKIQWHDTKIENPSKNVYKVFRCFKHVFAIQECDHFQPKPVRKMYLLENKEFIQTFTQSIKMDL